VKTQASFQTQMDWEALNRWQLLIQLLPVYLKHRNQTDQTQLYRPDPIRETNFLDSKLMSKKT
jgi:hypothetical protein